MTAKNSTFGPMNRAPLSLPMWRLWVGRVLSGLPVLMLLLSASMKLSHPPMVVETFVGKLGYPANILPALAVLELLCTVIYVVPRTAVLGAVLLTGYLGGAVATHVRVGEPFVIPLTLGVLVWAGLYLRDDRIPALLPLRKTAR
jgi:hypothetical protein